MAAGTSLGALFVELLFKDAEFSKGMKRAQGGLKDFGSNLDGLTSGIAAKFETAMAGLTAALLGVAAASGVIGAQFEQKITKVAVLAGASVDELAEAARRMGASTQFSAIEAADAMESLAQAGFKTGDIIGGTESALALAAASGGKLADATKIVATTMSQFSLDASSAGRISDVFTQALNSSQLGMEELTVAMSYAGTVGSSFGMSLEETTAAVAMFSNLGLEGSKAGTAFRMAMSQAATVSKSAESALAKYNNTMTGAALTAKDINPELHSFGEILEVVGSSGITASDAMVIFGTEVGGNVVALAQQSQQAGVDVHKTFAGITQDLMDSSGVAATTAQAMTQTVMGAFEQASGAFEEVLLSIFETYSGPLKALLLQIAEFLNEVGKQFQFSAGALSDGFGGMLGDLTEWIKENQTRFAIMIVVWTDRLLEVAAVLAKIIPHLGQILALMAAVWAVNQIVGFVTALGAAYEGVVGLQVVLAALGVEVSVMTAGIYALVVAIAAVIAVFVTYIAFTSDAEAATQRLTDAQARQSALNDAGMQQEIASMEARMQGMKDAATEELATRQDLSKARVAELEGILKLDAASAALAVRQGTLVDSAGELRTAASLVEEGFDTASADKLQFALQDLGTEHGQLRKRQVALKEEMDNVTAAIERGEKGAHLFAASIGAAVGEEGIGSLEDAQARFLSLGEEIDRVRGAQTKLRGDVVLAQRAMQAEATATTRQMGIAGRSTADFSKAERDEAEATAKALEASRKTVGEATAKLYQDTVDAALAAGLSERELAQAKLDAEIRDITKAFGEEQALYEGNAAKIAEIEGKKNEVIAMARDAFDKDQLAIRAKTANEIAKVALDIEHSYADTLAGVRTGVVLDSVRLEAERIATLTDLDQKLADALAGIEQLSAEERAAASTEILGGAAEERAAIELAYQQRIAEAQSQEPGRWEEVRTEIGAVGKALKGEYEPALDGVQTKQEQFLQDLSKTMGTLGDVFGAVRGAMSGVASGIASVGNGIASLTEKITGFAFSIQDVVTGVQDAAQAAGDAAGAAVTDAGGSEDAAAAASAAAMEGFDFSTAAVDFVNGLFGQAETIAEIMVSAVPPALQALADGLPALLQTVADAIPLIVQGVVDALPQIVQAIVDALPTIFTALVDGLVLVVQTVAAMLPGLVKDLMAMLPAMITQLAAGLADIVIAIAGAIPGIIDSLLEGLPAVLTAIIEAIPVLVLAIVAAIPEIVTSLLLAIPVLLGALLATIPQLLTTLIGMIPDILISLAQSLPTLLPAIIGLIPGILTEILVQLPQIAIALVMAIFTELIPRIPEIALSLVQGILEGLWNAIKDIGEFVLEAFKDAIAAIGDAINPFNDGKGTDKKNFGDVINPFNDKGEGNGFLGLGGGGGYSGVEYVPATMRMTLHKGEAVVPADRNAARVGGASRASPSAAGFEQSFPSAAGGESGGAKVELAVLVDGQVVDGALISSMGKGRAPKLLRMIRQTSGVHVGFDRGRFTPWSK